MTLRQEGFTLQRSSRQSWDCKTMPWSVLWSNKSAKQLKKMDKKTVGMIIDRVEDVKEDPFMAVSRLAGSQFYRLRVGGHRVILDLQQNKLVIFVVETDSRKRIYK